MEGHWGTSLPILLAVSDKQVINQLGNSPNPGVHDPAPCVIAFYVSLIVPLEMHAAHIIPQPLSQVSDDEDDTHPNIDTPSLFKWRHEARVQRMQEFEDKKKSTEQELSK